MNTSVHRLDSNRRGDFFALHSEENNHGWCFCTAWWLPSWDGWENRTAEENRAVREKLFEREVFDGYLLYADEIPVGWCQAGLRDGFQKLASQYNLTWGAQIFAITCFFIHPKYRRKGLSRILLEEVLRDLRRRGVKRVEAFPNCNPDLSETELWTGSEQIFVDAGFSRIVDTPPLPILELRM